MHLLQLVKCEDPLFDGWPTGDGLGLEDLHRKFFPDESYNGEVQLIQTVTPIRHFFFSAHRALDDVKAMSKIFNCSFLKPLLSTPTTYLTFRDKSQIVSNWRIRHQNLSTLKQYSVMGRYCSEAMANHLKRLDISYRTLKAVFDDHLGDHKAFNTNLGAIGIRRKVWQDKIWKHFQHVPS